MTSWWKVWFSQKAFTCTHLPACARVHTHTHTHTHTRRHTHTHKHMHAHKHTIFFLHVLISKFVSSVQYHPNGTPIRAHNAQWTLVHMQNDKKNSTHTKRHHRYFATCSVQGQHAHVVTKRLKDQRWSHSIFILDSQTCKPEPPLQEKSFNLLLHSLREWGLWGRGRGCSVPAPSKCVTRWPRLPFSIHTRQASQSHRFILSLLHDLYQPLHACLLCDDGVARVTAVIQLNQLSVFYAGEVRAFLCYHVQHILKHNNNENLDFSV